MRLQNYTLRYGQKVLLRNVTIRFPPGRINHLLGRNGCGKSTLAKSLVGLIPHEGTLDLEAHSATVIGSYSGLPLDLRVEDVLSLSYARSGKALYDEIYESLSLSSIDRKLRLRRLSDGQRQKLKLLFFLSNSPEVIILDECTGALDRKSANNVQSFLNGYLNRGGITSINITHDVSDLNAMPGANYLLEDESIQDGLSTQQIVSRYIGGEQSVL